MYRVIKRKHIDRDAWDACVESAPNGSIFGKSAFLDLAAQRWHGLVRGDYEYVFPLIEGSKFGLTYLYRAPGLARIDLYSSKTPSDEDWRQVFKIIRKKYLYVDILINGELTMDELRGAFHVSHPVSQYLDIGDNDFEEVWKNAFNASCRNIIRKATKTGLAAYRSDDVEEFMNLARNSVAADKIPKFHRQTAAMERFAKGALQNEFGELWFVRDGDHVHSSALVTYHREVLYLNFIFADVTGLKSNANYLLISEMIRAHSPNIHGFDFCGSDIESIGAFNRRFGSDNRSHTLIRTGLLAGTLSRRS